MKIFLAVSLLLPFSVAAETWTLGNDQIQRVITFRESSGLFTEALTDLTTRAALITSKDAAAPEFSFQCEGHLYKGASSDFSLISGEQGKLPNGKSLTVRLQGKQLPLQVTAVYEIYDGQPAIRKHLVLRNTGSADLHVTHLNIESIAPSVGLADEVTLNAQYGSAPRETFYTGRSEDAGLMVANGRTGIGFAVLSEVPGYMKRTEIDAWYKPGHVSLGALYDTDLLPFERSLKPKEEFVTAAVSIVTFQNGNGFHDPHWVLPSYTTKVLQRRVTATGSPWIYNTWEPLQRRIDEPISLALIDVAAKMGIDVFTIDDGWQEEYGENAVNRKAFPNGLEPILQKLDSKGMRLGLWVPLAAIGTGTADYQNHPDWIERNTEGEPKITHTAAGSKAVMCLASPFRQAAGDRINELITKYRVSYVKLDLTTMFNTYGEAPGCWAKGHFHKDWGESLNLIYEGIAFVTRKVYAEHPDVLLDLTFELWGQKHVIDAGLLAAGDLDWLSNVDDRGDRSAGPLQARTLLYQRASTMPAEAMLIGNLQAESHPIQERFATAIGSSPLLLGDLRQLSVADQLWYHQHIQWFKQLRSRAAINESFFPLGSWQQPSPSRWDGYGRLARSGDGVVVVFRNQAAETTANITLPLAPPGRTSVRSVITGKSLGVFTQNNWTRGIPVMLTGARAVEILELTAVGGQ